MTHRTPAALSQPANLSNPPPTPPTRADCIQGPRPCPHIRCRHHMIGESLTHTCALDLADQGGMTLDEVGQVLGVSRERVRQMEMAALHKIRRYFPRVEDLFGEDIDTYRSDNVPTHWGSSKMRLADGTVAYKHKTYDTNEFDAEAIGRY